MRITIKRIHIWILYIVMALTVITGLVFMFIMLLQCKPLEYFWTRTALDPNVKGYCIDIQIVIDMTYVYSAFAALCDFTVGTLPIFLVSKLQMRKKTKLAVVGILSMACMYVSTRFAGLVWGRSWLTLFHLIVPHPLSSSVSHLSRPSLILTSSVRLYVNFTYPPFQLTWPLLQTQQLK
jgi:hypothetical protein